MNKKKLVEGLQNNAVPLMFGILCIACILISGQNLGFVCRELISRIGRNAILILSLIPPVLCGMGLNFSIVLGAMAGEIGLILVTHWNIDGLLGILVAGLIGTLIAVILGALTGMLFNKTKGQEMITGMILGFFATGVFDLVFIFMVGTIIPMVNEEIMLQTTTAAGETKLVGLRNSIELHPATKYAVDNAWNVPFLKLLPWLIAIFGAVCVLVILWNKLRKHRSLPVCVKAAGMPLIITVLLAVVQLLVLTNKKFMSIFIIVQIPIFTGIVIAVFCAFVTMLMKTKLGQDIRTVGLDMNVANAAGINVDRTRIIATVLSTAIASWGQIISLQNLGNIQTFNSHEQVGTYAVAALLVGGASINKASIGQVFLGCSLFHLLFFISPLACKELFGDSMYGEYFRVFLCYGIIAIALIIYAWKTTLEAQRKFEIENRISM